MTRLRLGRLADAEIAELVAGLLPAGASAEELTTVVAAADGVVRGEGCGFGGVVYEFFHLLQIHFVGVADVEIGYGAVGDYVGGGAAFGDHTLNPGFGTDAGTAGSGTGTGRTRDLC